MSFLRVKKFQISRQQISDMFAEKLIAWSIINDSEDIIKVDLPFKEEVLTIEVTLKRIEEVAT